MRRCCAIVVNLSCECSYTLSPKFSVFHFPIHDSYNEDVGVVYGIWERVRHLIKEHGNEGILVHCLAGLSRSPACIIYAMMTEDGMTYSEALTHFGEGGTCCFATCCGSWSEKSPNCHYNLKKKPLNLISF